MKEKELDRLTNLKEIEKQLNEKGFKNICGIDEAGRGPLAGPVVVAGVIMPEDSMIEGVNDSKKVSEKKRELLYDKILEEAISYSVAIIGQDVIDDINILKGGPQNRRRFLDIMISQLRPNYMHILSLYNKTLEQRNNYLKQIKLENKPEEMLEIWDEKLAEYGEKIFIYRNEFMEKISEVFRWR